MNKLYIGAMAISNKPFLKSYEDPDSPQFSDLASLVSQQVRDEGIVGAAPLASFACHWRVCPPCDMDSCDVYVVVFQLKTIYSRNSVLAKSFTGSTVQAFR